MTNHDSLGVTEEEFRAYVRVQRSGEYNMLTERREAAAAAGLARERYEAVMREYGAALARYGSPS